MSNHSASEQEFMDKLDQFIQNNLENEHYGVSELANDLGMSRSNLLKRVKAITKITASQYIRQFKLRKAKIMLQETSLTVSEVSYKTGFSSPSYFIKCFRDHFGYSPGEAEKHNENEREQPISEKSDKKQFLIFFFSAFFLIIAAVLLIIVIKPYSTQQENKEKTIAVLPFIDDSPREGNTYIINGLMEEILDKLQKIGELKVKSRTDTEKYRDTQKSIAEIARELNVNYIIEGSGQVIDEKIKLSIQLIECTSGNHILSHIFTEDMNDIFTLQENVAFSIASELKASLSPKEEQQVEKQLTQNPTAYQLYLRGMNHMNTALYYVGHSGNLSKGHDDINRARDCFKQAVDLDSTFAEAYIQLSHYYIDLIFPTAHFHPHLQYSYMDSGLMYAKQAVKYDPESEWAATLMERSYRQMGMEKEAENWAIRNDKLLEDSNTEKYIIYRVRMERAHKKEDYYNNFYYYYKYLDSKPLDLETDLYLLQNVYENFEASGFPELAKSVAKEILTRNNDSTGYLKKTDKLNFLYGNNDSLETELCANNTGSVQPDKIKRVYVIAPWIQTFKDPFNYVLKPGEAEERSVDTLFICYPNEYMLTQLDYKKEVQYADVFIKNFTEELELKLPNAQNYYVHINLAYLYAMKGEKENALKYLKQTQDRKKGFPYIVIKLLKVNPIWDDYRRDPEFQKVLLNLEATFEKEHNRIEKLLKDLGKID